MFIKDLVEFGLGEKEAQVYLALLELEIAGVQEIAKAANINRSTAYVTLEALKKRGLVSVSDDKSIRQYVATSPDAILRAAQEKTSKQEGMLQRIESIVPEMKALFKGTKKKPLIKVFEGKEGIISAFEETLTSREKLMRVASAPANLGKLIYNYIPTYVEKRVKLGIKMYGIHPHDEPHVKLIQDTPFNIDTYATIPKNKFKFTADLAIYDDKIGYMSADNGGLAVIIESKEMSSVMKSMFDLAFEEAKRINKETKKTS
jgi:sugar-specific transcriptional regulator TrmB